VSDIYPDDGPSLELHLDRRAGRRRQPPRVRAAADPVVAAKSEPDAESEEGTGGFSAPLPLPPVSAAASALPAKSEPEAESEAGMGAFSRLLPLPLPAAAAGRCDRSGRRRADGPRRRGGVLAVKDGGSQFPDLLGLGLRLHVHDLLLRLSAEGAAQGAGRGLLGGHPNDGRHLTAKTTKKINNTGQIKKKLRSF